MDVKMSCVTMQDGCLSVVKAEGKRLWRMAHKLNAQAKLESIRGESDIPYFLALDPKHFTVYLLMKHKKPIGYAAWNRRLKDGKPVLRQIYIVPEERRKGYGSLLLENSRMDYAGSENFYVEAPISEAAALMLVKLGYAELDGEYVLGKTISFLFT